MPTYITIDDLNVVTSAAAGDFVPIWRAANADTRKITKANFMGATLTGAGTIATAGYTLTIPKTGTAVVGTGTAGRIAEWVTDANTLQASTLAKSGAGVLTLSAAGAYTFTVPATGTASLLGTAQTHTALKTFSNGISFGQDTLNYYDEGTWTPVIADASSGGNVASMTIDVANYVRIGNMVFANVVLSSINTAGMTAGNPLILRGLPFTVVGQSYSSIYASFMTYAGELNVNPAGSTTFCFFISIDSASAQNVIKVSAITSTSCRIGAMLVYQTS